MEYYQKSATLGFSEAMTDLGYIYEKGLLGKKNKEMAKKWYEKALEKHNPRAMCNLAIMYYEKDIPENFADSNPKKAYDLLVTAKDLGYTKALTNLGIFYTKGIYV